MDHKETIRLYIGINETKWNHHPVAPGPYACIAPVYGATEHTKKKNAIVVPKDTVVISDSAAFSDSRSQRLHFKEAMVRQINHAIEYKYEDQLEAMASYDLLIDEKWIDGARFKKRWSETEAGDAVAETIQAARYVADHRSYSPCKNLVMSAQGVSARQYLSCVQQIADYFDGEDILGLGGWCILGKMRSLMPIFRETISLAIPFASQFTKRIHIWGVLYAPALGELLWICDKYGLQLSTDSSGPSVRPARGVWGYMGWTNKEYMRPPVEIRGLERARHVCEVRRWLSKFRETEFYKGPKIHEASIQLSCF